MIRGALALLASTWLIGCSAPLEPSGSDQPWVGLTMGAGHGCVLDQEGRIGCFGANSRGQLGIGTEAEPDFPALLPIGSGFLLVDAGAYHTCAIGPARGVWCWGANDEAQLGLGDRKDRALPVRLDLPGDFLDVSAGLSHSCATRVDGLALCWGSNRDGQLGIGLEGPGPYAPTVIEGVWSSVAAGAPLLRGGPNRGAVMLGLERLGPVGDGNARFSNGPQPRCGGRRRASEARSRGRVLLRA